MQPADGEKQELSDTELAAAAGAGDYSAFETLVHRYRDRVYRLALGMTHDPAEAEEAVQDTFLNVFRNLETFRGEASVGSWIYRVAANACLMLLRRKRRKPLLSIEDASASDSERSLMPLGDWSRSPDEKLLSRELGDRIEDAIGELPEKYRMVLLLRDVEGLSSEEVAQTLGLTVPTVKTRLHRSRLFVRDRLEHYFRRA